MKKEYQEPIIEILVFGMEDVLAVTASPDGNIDDEGFYDDEW